MHWRVRGPPSEENDAPSSAASTERKTRRATLAKTRRRKKVGREEGGGLVKEMSGRSNLRLHLAAPPPELPFSSGRPLRVKSVDGASLLRREEDRIAKGRRRGSQKSERRGGGSRSPHFLGHKRTFVFVDLRQLILPSPPGSLTSPTDDRSDHTILRRSPAPVSMNGLSSSVHPQPRRPQRHHITRTRQSRTRFHQPIARETKVQRRVHADSIKIRKV